jgi:hypothetical protein
MFWSKKCLHSGMVAIAPVTVSTSKDGMTIHFFFISSPDCGMRILMFSGQIRNADFIHVATMLVENSTTITK